jgi:hypothetical protein
MATDTNETFPNRAQAPDLFDLLVTKNVRGFLFPLTKRLGGLPKELCAKYNEKWAHYTNMSREPLADALIDVYGPERIHFAMAEQDGESEQRSEKRAQTESSALATLHEAIRKLAAGGVDEDRVREIVIVADCMTGDGLTEKQVGDLVDTAVSRMCDDVIAATSTAAVEHGKKVGERLQARLAEFEERLTKAFENAKPRNVVVQRPELPDVDVGVQHERFETLLSMCCAKLPNGRRINVWLHGPAGTGKTRAAHSVADAMGLKFYFTGAIETAFALMGYTDAHGRLVRTPFRDAWEQGGVFLMDEADASHPQALAALNAAIDGGVAAFPDKMVDRHDDCVIVAGANTVGRGGNTQYAGRVRQDGAFLSRWAMLEWPHDDKLESAIAGGDPVADAWVELVRAYRRVAVQQKIDGVSTTTRSSLDGAAMLRVGVPIDMVIEATIRKGLAIDSWQRLDNDSTVSSVRGGVAQAIREAAKQAKPQAAKATADLPPEPSRA